MVLRRLWRATQNARPFATARDDNFANEDKTD